MPVGHFFETESNSPGKICWINSQVSSLNPVDQYIFLKKHTKLKGTLYSASVDTKKLQALPGLWCPTPVWVITDFLKPTNTLKRDSPGGSWGSMLTQTKDKRSQGMGSSNQVREMKRHPPLVKEGSSTSNSGFLWPTCFLRLFRSLLASLWAEIVKYTYGVSAPSKEGHFSDKMNQHQNLSQFMLPGGEMPSGRGIHYKFQKWLKRR